VILTDGTAYDPGNGVLDLRHGDRVRVIYADEEGGSPVADLERVSSSAVDCQVGIAFGNITFYQLGTDTGYLVVGGCERNARGQFETGYPDRYMDAGESIVYYFAFASSESHDLYNAEVDLRCVRADR